MESQDLKPRGEAAELKPNTKWYWEFWLNNNLRPHPNEHWYISKKLVAKRLDWCNQHNLACKFVPGATAPKSRNIVSKPKIDPLQTNHYAAFDFNSDISDHDLGFDRAEVSDSDSDWLDKELGI
jgi:hypothetical protein